jgi:hypothetical protein
MNKVKNPYLFHFSLYTKWNSFLISNPNFYNDYKRLVSLVSHFYIKFMMGVRTVQIFSIHISLSQQILLLLDVILIRNLESQLSLIKAPKSTYEVRPSCQ